MRGALLLLVLLFLGGLAVSASAFVGAPYAPPWDGHARLHRLRRARAPRLGARRARPLPPDAELARRGPQRNAEGLRHRRDPAAHRTAGEDRRPVPHRRQEEVEVRFADGQRLGPVEPRKRRTASARCSCARSSRREGLERPSRCSAHPQAARQHHRREGRVTKQTEGGDAAPDDGDPLPAVLVEERHLRLRGAGRRARPEQGPPVRADAMLMEGFRRIDEWPMVRRRSPGPVSSSSGRGSLPKDDGAGAAERLVYALAEPGVTVQRLATSRLGEFRRTRRSRSSRGWACSRRARRPADGGGRRARSAELGHLLRRGASRLVLSCCSRDIAAAGVGCRRAARHGAGAAGVLQDGAAQGGSLGSKLPASERRSSCGGSSAASTRTASAARGGRPEEARYFRIRGRSPSIIGGAPMAGTCCSRRCPSARPVGSGGGAGPGAGYDCRRGVSVPPEEP